MIGLGYSIVGSYEKVREEWHINYADKRGVSETCKIELDTVVFGHVIEIEGSIENMAKLEKDLELTGLPTSTDSYFNLYRDWLKKQKMLFSTHMKFPAEQKGELRRSLGLPI